MTLPTLEEISPTGLLNLDESLAYLHFYGLGVADACSLISGNPNFYLDDLASMGPKAFAFYSRAVICFLNGNRCRENIDLVKQMITVRAVFPCNEDVFLRSIEDLHCHILSLEKQLGGREVSFSSAQIDKEYRKAIALIIEGRKAQS